ncbi:integrase catalytic domain-containing protein [Trichonephila clavata]|uniref:Integrase catalytic domain-containing protein n=1 Tax=Trichonephila clavata TaxID=2740835 RepID=A0A8X6KUJ8_TRICU|nr:integrase catalytic domain-containing protein [Trichonephila clavata]
MNSELAQNQTENLAVVSSISNLDQMKGGSQSVFLQTCVVDLRFQNTWIEANLLFDSGSMRSFICKNLAEGSSISKVFRITAWIRRFINNLKLKKEDRIKTPLSAEEIEPEEIWIKKVQAEKFGIEINCMKENKILPKDSKIRDLNPFLNEKGILRISGKLQQSTLSYHEKHPIFFDSS